MLLKAFPVNGKRVEPAWDEWREWLGTGASKENGESGETTLRYLPTERLAAWDLRYEHGLDRLLYIQNLIEED